MPYNLTPISYEIEENGALEDLTSEPENRYLNGVAFDYKAGDFQRDGKNKLMDANGIESWKSWCHNCIQTERYSCLAYGPDLGIETAEAFSAESREEAESILARQITEAIMADPYQRTLYVSDIIFSWEAPDAVTVDVTIQGVEDVTIDITAYITKGGM